MNHPEGSNTREELSLLGMMKRIRERRTRLRGCYWGSIHTRKLEDEGAEDRIMGLQEDDEWDNVVLRCRTHPSELFQQSDERGRTCLHVACATRAPIYVLQAMIQIEGGSIKSMGAAGRTTSSLHLRDNHGRTPLAVALANNLPKNSIDLLLATRPDAAFISDNMGYTALHLICSGTCSSCRHDDRSHIVEQLLNINPQAAGQDSFKGETPLHVAVEGGAPLEVIQQLVKACPRSVVKDGCGANPLFLAIRHNCCVEIVRCLVEACPNSTTLHQQDSFCLPFRFALEWQAPIAIQKVLCTSPEVVVDADPYVRNTVLHQMLRDGVCVHEDTVRLMLQVEPMLANQPSKNGSTPTDLALERFVTLRRPSRQKRETMWRVASLLLRTSCYGTVNDCDNDTPVLHALVSRKSCPMEALRFAVQNHPDQLRTRDCRGNYPLHLAIQSRPLMARGRVSDGMASNDDKVQELLRQCPDSVRFPAVVHSTQLIGKTETLVSTLALAARHVSSIRSEAVWCELMHLAPTSLRELDPVFGLYPFLVVAAKNVVSPSEGTGSSSERIRAHSDTAELTILYRLIHQTPDLLYAHLSTTQVQDSA